MAIFKGERKMIRFVVLMLVNKGKCEVRMENLFGRDWKQNSRAKR